ncbi:uncharacterized protein LOC9662099 [Selaginella moellendorffii]|uniref:uncharacterized protein LOC9662099 n=1 Tax=Selaginella moellendorffii TaxID=88036 RepID=UPI000D1CC83F|nr:uncharacterized protein LOC9662099 [Selaginella moellendorffii]|eukprot:XP_024543696.1 uncharacterized protein LOC9662099 [Selaginella moellendorffii]
MERLTEDLLLRVFASLELDDLGRLRCVCRSWDSAITSHEFAKQWKGRDEVCCVLRTKDSIHREVWFPGSGARRSTGLNPGPRGCFSIGVSSSHGLVCGLLPEEGRYWNTPDTAWKFVVGNPLTSKWRRLPPIDIPSRPLYTMERIHLQADPSKGSYKLVITYSEDGVDYQVIYQARQYDSESRVWTSAVPFIGEHDCANTKIDGSVIGSAGLHYPPYFLMAYNPDSMAWSCHKHFVGGRDPTPLNESVYKEYKLDCTTLCDVLRWRGRNFMVTHSFSCVVLWELDTVAGEWKVLSSRRYKELYGRMPSRENSDIQALLVGSTIVSRIATRLCMRMLHMRTTSRTQLGTRQLALRVRTRTLHLAAHSYPASTSSHRKSILREVSTCFKRGQRFSTGAVQRWDFSLCFLHCLHNWRSAVRKT